MMKRRPSRRAPTLLTGGVAPEYAFSKYHHRSGIAASVLSASPSPFASLRGEQQSLVRAGLHKLAERETKLRGEALAVRAVHEWRKFTWAFPPCKGDAATSLPSLARCLAQHGFSHRAACIAQIRASLREDELRRLRYRADDEDDGDADVSKPIVRALRSAIEQRKADATVDVRRACLAELRGGGALGPAGAHGGDPPHASDPPARPAKRRAPLPPQSTAELEEGEIVDAPSTLRESRWYD